MSEASTPEAPKKKRGRGRLPDEIVKMTPEVRKAIVEAVALHVPLALACERLGITRTTVANWMHRGKENLESKSERLKPYQEFYLAIQKAKADAVANGIVRIQQAARGGNVIERVTRTTKKIIDGKEVVETVVNEKVAPAQWTADAWMLERTRPEYFAQNRGEIRALEKELADAYQLINDMQEQMLLKLGDAISALNQKNPPLILEAKLPETTSTTPTHEAPLGTTGGPAQEDGGTARQDRRDAEDAGAAAGG